MTNKMRLIFIIATAVSALLVVLSTPFAVDIAERALLAVANALDLHSAPVPSALAVLLIPGLYLVFRQGRRA
jgi:hypothetical protein